MTVRAQIVSRDAGLRTDFGMDMARRYFGDAILSDPSLPRFARGKHKGQLKVKIHWKKVERGGWRHLEGGGGYVENRAGKSIEIKLRVLGKYGSSEPGQLIAEYGPDADGVLCGQLSPFWNAAANDFVPEPPDAEDASPCDPYAEYRMDAADMGAA